jgi:hypothetical protein
MTEDLNIPIKNDIITAIDDEPVTVSEWTGTFSPDRVYHVKNLIIKLKSGAVIKLENREPDTDYGNCEVIANFDEIKLIPVVLKVFADSKTKTLTIGALIQSLLKNLNSQEESDYTYPGGVISIKNKNKTTDYYIKNPNYLMEIPELDDDNKPVSYIPDHGMFRYKDDNDPNIKPYLTEIVSTIDKMTK